MVKLYLFNILIILFLQSSVIFSVTTPNSNPGFQARITSKGLNYASSQAINVLSKKVKDLKIPDQNGKSGKITYSISGIKISGFRKPTSNIAFVAGVGLKWSISGAGMSLSGNWRYKYKKGWIKVSDHGRFDGSVSGISFSLTMDIGKDSNGRPKVSATSCSCSIGSVHIKFHGGASWIYNLFSHKIENKIKDMLQGKMCDIAKNAVNTDGENQLKKLPVNVELAKKFMLDYSLLTKPIFTSSYLQTFHKGEIYWKGDKTECPFKPAVIPTSKDSSKMVYLWLSDYMANSMGYTAYKHGYLKYNLTAKDLPAGNRSVLNTTCSGLFCIGKIIPQIGEKYPNHKVKVNMIGTSAPQMKISSSSIVVTATGNLNLYAQKAGTPDVFLLRLNMTLGITLKVSLKNELLYATVSNPQLKIGVLKSAIGTVSGTIIQTLAQLAVKLVVIPMLNKQGAKGLSLPITGNVKFTQSQLILQTHSLMIATDLVYKPNVAVRNDLKFSDTWTEDSHTLKKPVFHVVSNQISNNMKPELY